MPLGWGEGFRSLRQSMEMRQSKRYRLRASVTFSWEHADGNPMRGEGYTRDISPAGVFVLTSDRLPVTTAVKLEVTLPSLNQNRRGPSLRTQGRVVRLEEIGFAAAAEIGFRMQFSERSSSTDSLGKRGGNGKFEAGSKRSNPLPPHRARFAFMDVSRAFSIDFQERTSN
jgi:hypothetical protein